MISYSDIYEALRKERYSEQLQPIPKKFVIEVSNYFQEKRNLSQQTGQSELFSEDIAKTKKQIENAASIFKELMLLRKKKLLSLAFVASETGINKRDFDNMLDFERELFDKIMVSVQEAEKRLSFDLNGSSNYGVDQEMKLILFLDNVEELIGLDGKTIGPFKKDEITLLPKQVAEIFVSDKLAQVILDEGER
ncbi:MAG: hypothetical protein AABX03_00230 [Nanoarchaeota archaeon]